MEMLGHFSFAMRRLFEDLQRCFNKVGSNIISAFAITVGLEPIILYEHAGDG